MISELILRVDLPSRVELIFFRVDFLPRLSFTHVSFKVFVSMVPHHVKGLSCQRSARWYYQRVLYERL